ncbi:hypothetical protein Maynard_74 [Salmonella phage Maynard]|uniref:Clamp loader subunit n=3 Tax=Kuttervirus TaxID=2169536 RepID=W8JYX7_9CAUD|nr:hypothetical protein Maynard_74 [Salmonella phage Maynard]YP_008771692.1 hypothetical protein Marshall_74 [Salmonella phage Marshall]YP_009021433.1 hypothetical protein DF52_gp154 [Salmonella phage vB-SalM-SJ2]AXY85185.1 hypothetical protein Mooltan_081 [Salmonella phage Mooltan]QEA10199.1 hypothetical protein CPT_Matapan_088 [Salmonella phage Matapan]QPX74002.1 putative clamp loader subunit [Salmonella phage AR2819]QPX74574.1 hypothetical protein Sajous1_172 [Salmonella phage Sajous1]WDR
MKQFVGLYAVGEEQEACPALKGVYLHSLYCTSKFVVTPMMVIPLLPDTKGLYVGIIQQGQAREVKVVPLLECNEQLLCQLLDPEVLQQCISTMGCLFGSDKEGEATPAYVNQDK